MANKNTVLFKYGNQAAYDALKNSVGYDSNALYFIEDTNRLYKGAVLMSKPYLIVEAVPQPDTALEDVFYLVVKDDKATIHFKNEDSIISIESDSIEAGSVTMDSLSPDALASTIGEETSSENAKLVTDDVVKKYVEANNETIKSDIETDLKDSVVQQVTEKIQNDLKEYDKAFVNVAVGESSNQEADKIGLHFSTKDGQEVVVDLDKEKFLNSAKLKDDGKTLELTMTNGDTVDVSLAEMVADASTVKTTDKIKLTTSWGNLAVGSEIASDTSLQQLLIDALSKDIDPIATLPTATITLTNAGAKEVGTNITPAYSVKYTDGKYSVTIDSESAVNAGCTATTYHVTDTKSNSASEASGTLPSFQVTDDMDPYKVSVTVDYSKGNDAYSYLGTKKDDVTIAAGTTTQATASGTITGYRGWFWGYKLSGDTIISDVPIITGEQVRALGNVGTSLPTSAITLPKNCQEVFFAIPKNKKTGTLKVLNSANQAPFGDGQKITGVQVEGAEGYTAVEYDVYYIHNGGGAPDEAKYTVTIS